MGPDPYRPRIARRPIRCLAVAALAAVGAACGGGPPTPGQARADQLAGAATAADLPPDVVALLADAGRSVDSTYRLVYEVASGTGTPNRVEVSQRPPRRRVDVVAPDGTADTTITDGEASWQCRLDGTWRCDSLGEPAVGAALDQGVIDALVAALVAGAGDYDFGVEARDVLGEPARCLVTSLRPDAVGTEGLGRTGELCLAADGAVLLVDTPSGTLRAIEHSPTVADDAFELPAAPST